MRRDSARIAAGVSHACAALLGTLPIALLASLMLARHLPVDAETRFVTGFSLCLPVWIALITLAWVARHALVLWLLSAAATVALFVAGG